MTISKAPPSALPSMTNFVLNYSKSAHTWHKTWFIGSTYTSATGQSYIVHVDGSFRRTDRDGHIIPRVRETKKLRRLVRAIRKLDQDVGE